jgi:hypothetical protein
VAVKTDESVDDRKQKWGARCAILRSSLEKKDVDIRFTSGVESTVVVAAGKN